jgi:hypothetical protein
VAATLSRKPALIASDVLPKSRDYGGRVLPKNQISSGFGSGVDLLGYHQLYFSHRPRASRNDFRHPESDNLVGFDCEANERYKHTTLLWRRRPLDDNAAVAAEFPHQQLARLLDRSLNATEARPPMHLNSWDGECHPVHRIAEIQMPETQIGSGLRSAPFEMKEATN